MVIQYPNSPSRVVKLTASFKRYGRQLALGDIPTMTRALVATPDVKKEILHLICKEVTSEIVGKTKIRKNRKRTLRKSSTNM